MWRSVAVSIDSVSKRFRLNSGKPRSVKERVIHPGRRKIEDFWALRDISFDIDEGETLGLLGHNGSGKSTLLKLVGGIMQPTTGLIRVRGRLASLLELGAGFHPELTGRENVYMNAAVLGLKRVDIEKRFDDIVEFAELERFIDQQVKHYSSGMYVRLGFAVAVNVDPDVLLVDEVLAVGDETFQRKCLDRVHQFQDEGRTIVVVSHSADLMRRICTRVGVLDHGDLVALAQPGEAIRTFRERLHAEEVERRERLESRGLAGDAHTAHGFTQEERKSLEVRITSVELDHPGQRRPPVSAPGRATLGAGELRVRASHRRRGVRLRRVRPRRRPPSLRGEHRDARRADPVRGGRGRGRVRHRVGAAARRHVPDHARDPQPRRRHRLRLERAASLVRSDEPREDDRHGRAAGEGEGDRLTAADGEVDLDVVIAEIYDAVAQRRASGELPADLEAELDAEFAELRAERGDR